MKLVRNKYGFKLTNDNYESKLCPFTTNDRCCGDWCPHFITALRDDSNEVSLNLYCVALSSRGNHIIIE